MQKVLQHSHCESNLSGGATVFHLLGFLGPVSDLSEAVKEIVCIVQADDLKLNETDFIFLKKLKMMSKDWKMRNKPCPVL